MYTSLQEAKEEIWKRWNDAELQREVLKYIGELPEKFGHEPVAFLARPVATPNFESYAFKEVAQQVSLLPINSEFLGDKLYSGNSDKLALGKLTFFHGKGRNNGNKTTSRNIINFNTEDGQPFKDVRTAWGEEFVTFHHRMLSAELPGIELTDNSRWINKMGGKPELFYPRLLALFICHGVLFENFHTEGHEAEFNHQIVRPAYEKVIKHFGIKPLIVPVVPLEREREQYWTWYPGHLDKEVKTLVDGAK